MFKLYCQIATAWQLGLRKKGLFTVLSPFLHLLEMRGSLPLLSFLYLILFQLIHFITLLNIYYALGNNP